MNNQHVRRPALELAINLLRQMINDPAQRYWGTTYIDSVFPVIEAFDIETDCTWVIFCYSQSKSDAEMKKLRDRLIRFVSDRYAHGEYVTGVIPALYGSDCQVVEVEWSPSDEMRRDHNHAVEQRYSDMNQRLLDRIDEYLADMPQEGGDDAS